MISRTDQGQRAGTAVIPAPVGGLNTRDAVAAMPPEDAETLVNFDVFTDRVETRAGFALFGTLTGDAAAITSESLIQIFKHPGGSTGTDAFYALYGWLRNVTGNLCDKRDIVFINATSGVCTNFQNIVPAATTDKFVGNSAPFTFTDNAGNTYTILVTTYSNVTGAVFTTVVYAVSGAASASTLSITGVSQYTTKGCSHQRRIWFLTNGIPGYLPVGATSGAVVNFDVRPQLRRGGYIADMISWPVDNGVGGIDDKLVFISTTGEIVVYEGTDPSSIVTWRLVGVFDSAAPASPAAAPTAGVAATRGFVADVVMRFNDDLLYFGKDGLISLKRLIMGEDPYAIAAKIRPSLALATVNGQLKILSARQARRLVLVIPDGTVTGYTSTQSVSNSTLYLMNTETGAWMKWGVNIRDIVETATGMLFTDGTLRVFKYDGTAATDNGTTITFEARQAYNYLQNPGPKLITMVEPSLKATGNFSMAIAVDADFNAGTLSTYPSYTVSGTQYLKPQPSANQYGTALALHIKGQTSAGVVSWYSTRWLAQQAKGF